MSYDQVQDIIDQFTGDSGGTGGGGSYGQIEGNAWGNEFTAGLDSASIGDVAGGAGGGGGGEAGGMGGAGGGGEGGMGSAGVVGIILAIIAAQMVASNNTDSEMYGEGAGNWFTFEDDRWEPHMTTEPWLELAHDKLGWEPSAGMQFDSAMWGDESSEGDRWRTAPGAMDYYADPIRSWLGYNTWYNLMNSWSDDEDMNKVIATLIDPIGGIMNQIDEWFD
jgi:hypothetical protein